MVDGAQGALQRIGIVTCLEADRRVCMLDRAGAFTTNELFRFSTTTMQWEQLDLPQGSGSPPSPRSGHGMVAVGSDLYVFGGRTHTGDAIRCAAGHRLGACQLKRLGDALRVAAVLVATCCARVGCHNKV